MSAGDSVPLYYFKAKALVPDLPPLQVGPDLLPGSADAEARYENGNTVVQVRSDYPSPLLTHAQQEIERENTFNHEFGHPYDKYLTSLGRDHHARYWAFRRFRGSWDQAQAEADAKSQDGWTYQPRESWAECFGAAMSGRWTKPEKTFDDGKPVDALAARAFFQSLAGVPISPPILPPVQKAKVLWHLSHHSSSKPDGWSGAPDEARWVREDLTPRVVAACRQYGIELVLVDGDLLDHPQFHADYLAFIAPHYEANLHGHGGWFWGRADQSSTPHQDDIIGAIFERRYIALTHPTGGPPIQMAWTNPNVTDYYGFRLTSADTPGILVEHGVGWNVPADYDFTWLRTHVQEIADIWALTLLEFAGGQLPVEEPVTDQEFMEKYERLVKPGMDGTIQAVKDRLAIDAHHRHENPTQTTSEPK